MTASIALDQVSSLLSTPSETLPCPAVAGGWLTSCRMGKRVGFLVLHDGSSVAPLQVVVPDALLQAHPDLRGLTAGCSVRVTGSLVLSQGAGQRLEMQAEHVEVLGWVDDPKTYPIQPKPLGADFLRTVPHLRARVVHVAAVARLRHAMAKVIHGYFDQLGQLEAEALCMALGRVYTFGPTFRAERSRTSRHLAEFWMVEPEVAFVDLAGLMGLSEGLVKHCIAHCVAHLPEEMALFAQEGAPSLEAWEQMIQAPFARVSYTDAIALLEQSDVAFSTPVAWGDDLHAEHERWLVERLGGPVFVTHYPADLKAFYMKETEGGRTVAAMDLLVPRVGELVGGSEREEDLERLSARMRHHGLDPADYAEYLDLRRYGTVPHGGFGLGFERLVAFISGVASVKDAIAYPRTAGG